jgi:enamine deaminase RidA (YjgF/YER057c/UK114 family)
MKTLQPPGWPRPSGYVHGVSGEGTTVFVSGQIGWNEHGEFVSDELAGQVTQALRNVVQILAEAGAGPEHIARMTWYLTDRAAYLAALPEIGAAYRSVMGHHYAAMSVVEVRALVEDRALVEIEVTALLPPGP